MTGENNVPDYEAIAVRLDRWWVVPTEVLAAVVGHRGLCLRGLWPAREPDWEVCAPSDRALAEQLCEGCPVSGQCLELDLRMAGVSATGVWGALAEDDRRALHPIWRQRRHPEGTDQKGGSTP